MSQHSRKRKALETEDGETANENGRECIMNREIIYEHIFSTPKNFTPRCLISTNQKDNLRKHFINILLNNNCDKRTWKKEWYNNLFKICLYNEKNSGELNRVKESKEKLIYISNIDEVLEKVQHMVERKFDCENLYYQNILIHASLLFDYFLNKKNDGGNRIKNMKEQVEQEKINARMISTKPKENKESKKRPFTKSPVSNNNEAEYEEEVKNSKHSDLSKHFYILELKSLLANEKNKFKNLEIFYHITNFIIHKYWNSREYSNYNVFIWFLNYIKIKLDIKRAIHKVNEHLEMFINLHPKIFSISHAKKRRKKSGSRTPTTQYYENGVLDYPFVKNRCRQTGGGYPEITEVKNKNEQNVKTVGNFNQMGTFGNVQNNNSSRSIFGNSTTAASMKPNTGNTGTSSFTNSFKPFSQNSSSNNNSNNNTTNNSTANNKNNNTINSQNNNANNNQNNTNIFNLKGVDTGGTGNNRFFKESTSSATTNNLFTNSTSSNAPLGSNSNPLSNAAMGNLGNFNFNTNTGNVNNANANTRTNNLLSNTGSSSFLMNMNQSNNTMNNFGMNLNKSGNFAASNNNANTCDNIFGNSSTGDNKMNMTMGSGRTTANLFQNTTNNVNRTNNLFGSTNPTTLNTQSSTNLFGFNTATGNNNNLFGNTSGNVEKKNVDNAKELTGGFSKNRYNSVSVGSDSFMHTPSDKSSFQTVPSSTSGGTENKNVFLFAFPSGSTMNTTTRPTQGTGIGLNTGSTALFGSTNSTSTGLFGNTKNNDNIFNKPSVNSGSIFGNPTGGSVQSPFSKAANTVNSNAPGGQLNAGKSGTSAFSSSTNNTSAVDSSKMINLFTSNNAPKELFKDLKLNNESGTKFSVVKKPLFSRSTKNSLFSSNTLSQENNLFNVPFMNKENSLLNNSEKPTKVIFGTHNNLSNESGNNIFSPLANNALTSDPGSKTIFGQNSNLGSNTGITVFGAASNNTSNKLASFGNTNIFGASSDANRRDGGSASSTLVIPTKKLTLEERKKKTMKHNNIVSLFCNNTNANANTTNNSSSAFGVSTSSLNITSGNNKDVNSSSTSVTENNSGKTSGNLLFGSNTFGNSILNAKPGESNSKSVFGFNKDSKFDLNNSKTTSGHDSSIIFGIGGTQKSTDVNDKTKENSLKENDQKDSTAVGGLRKEFLFSKSTGEQEKQKENEQKTEVEKAKGREGELFGIGKQEEKNKEKESAGDKEKEDVSEKEQLKNNNEKNKDNDDKKEKEMEQKEIQNASGILGFSSKEKESVEKTTLQENKSKDDLFSFKPISSLSAWSTNMETNMKQDSKEQNEKTSIFDTNKEQKAGSIFGMSRTDQHDTSKSHIFSLNSQRDQKEGSIFTTEKDKNKNENIFANVSSKEYEFNKMNETVNYNVIKNRERRKIRDIEKDTPEVKDSIEAGELGPSRKRKMTTVDGSDVNNFSKKGVNENDMDFFTKNKVNNNLLDTKNFLNVLLEQPKNDSNTQQFQDKEMCAKSKIDKSRAINEDASVLEKDISNQSMHLTGEKTQTKQRFEHMGSLYGSNNVNMNNRKNNADFLFNGIKNVGEEFVKKQNEERETKPISSEKLTDHKETTEHTPYSQFNHLTTKKVDGKNINEDFKKKFESKIEYDSTNDRKRRREEPFPFDQKNEKFIEYIKNIKQNNDSLIEQKRINKIVEYKKHIDFDSIDVDLDMDMLDTKDLRHKLFLCVLNFHFVFWAEKTILFYPNNERINKFCKKLMKLKNEFDETYNFSLFEKIQKSAQKLIKTLNSNSCIYDSVLFLTGENINILKNAKLSLFDAFNIYHFWFQRNVGDVKKNLQIFFYTNKIYPYYLNFHLNLYKNYTAYTYKRSDLKKELVKKTKRKGVKKNEKRMSQARSVRESSIHKEQDERGFGRKMNKKMVENKSVIQNGKCENVRKHGQQKESEETYTETDEEEEDEEYEEDEEDSEEDDGDEDEEEEEDEEEDESRESDDEENEEEAREREDKKKSSAHRQMYDHAKGYQKKKKTDRDGKEENSINKNEHKTDVSDKFEDVLNSCSSEESDMLDNSSKYENLNIHVKQKYLYSVRTNRKKRKFELPSYIKIKRLSACECILLELMLKDNVLGVLKRYKFFKTERYEFLYVNLISMLKYYNFFTSENDTNTKSKTVGESFEKFEDTNRLQNEDPINSKNEKILLLKKLCDKNLLYYLNLQLKNICHLMDHNEIELGCVYLNHIKNNLYVTFQMPIMLLNVLYEKIVKSFNDYLVLDAFFNNSKLFSEFRYEYIFKTKIAYIFCKKFYAMNDIENALKFAQYFDMCQVKVQKKSIYNDYIFHKNLVNSYIKVHPSIVPKEWILLQNENKESTGTGLNDTKQYLDYYTFFFKDISKYIKFNIVEQIINYNIFSLCKDEEASKKNRNNLYQTATNMEKPDMSMGIEMGMDIGLEMQIKMEMQKQKQNSILENSENQFLSYFRYMVKKSLLDDVINMYASRGEYFYKRIISILANNTMEVKVDSSVSLCYYLFQQMASVNHIMQNSLFKQLSIIKKKELYNDHKEDFELQSLLKLKEDCQKNVKIVNYIIQTILGILSKLEKTNLKDINIYLIVNLRNIILDIFYLFKYVLSKNDYSVDLLNVLYRNVISFNEIIYSTNSEEFYIFPMEQIRELFATVKEKYIHQDIIE